MNTIDNPDFVVAGWRVDREGNAYKLFRRMTVKAEEWHQAHPWIGVQYGRSIAVNKSDQEAVRAAIEKSGLVIRDRTHIRERTLFVGDVDSCRRPE